MYIKKFRHLTSSPANRCSFKVRLLSVAAIVFLLFAHIAATTPAAVPRKQLDASSRWWKGNLHTHSLWSDGRHYPEMVVEWYKKHGYHFLALSDHNILSQGQKWIDKIGKRATEKAFQQYLDRFGEKWVEQRTIDGKAQVRLKPLSEFRCLFEESGRFLLIQGEEINYENEKRHLRSAHINATNVHNLVLAKQGGTVAEVLQNNVNAVLAQRWQTRQAMFSHINHPNFRWALTAEDIMSLKGVKFFEVYNGGPKVNNNGDLYHASTERLWDIILTKRLAELNLPIMYGIATDDAHSYLQFGPKNANPGRGWVVVRASHLSPESIIKAMEAGDFYASTGVILKDTSFDGKTLKVVIEPEKGISYTTQFIGTLRGYDPTSKPVTDANGVELPVTRIYSNDIGKVLAEVKGTEADYTFAGNEIYVRAKVISTKLKDNPIVEGNVEVAWVQPVVSTSR